MISLISMSFLVLFFMFVDIWTQKSKKHKGDKLVALLLTLISVPVLSLVVYDIETNFDFVLNGIGIFLSFATWILGTIMYLVTFSNGDQFKYHLWKGFAIASTSTLVFIEAGYLHYLLLFGVLCWIVNDLLWNLFFKQKWYYKGDGKSDLFDIVFKKPINMIITKVIFLILGILLVTLL